MGRTYRGDDRKKHRKRHRKSEKKNYDKERENLENEEQELYGQDLSMHIIPERNR